MDKYDFVKVWKNDADYDIDGPVILCTIEELSDLWNAGYRAGLSDFGKETKIPAVDLETYLTSKGITLP